VRAPIELPLWRAVDLLYPIKSQGQEPKAIPMTLGGRLPYWGGTGDLIWFWVWPVSLSRHS